MLHTFIKIFLILLGIIISPLQAKASSEMQTADGSDSIASPTKYRILCIDDCLTQQILYNLFWGQYSNIDYVKAISANEGYTKLQEEQYHAVLLDYSMPDESGGTGRDLLTRIRKEPIPGLENKPGIFIASSSEKECNTELLVDFPEYICSTFPKSRETLNERTLKTPLMQAGVPELIMDPCQKKSKRKGRKKRSRSGDSTMSIDGTTFVPVASLRSFE